MSNFDNEDNDPILDAIGVREDVVETTPGKPNPLKAFVKPTVHVDTVATQEMEGAFTPEQVILMSKLIEQNTRKAVKEAQYDPMMSGQVLSKGAAPITDFSKLTLDDVYDLNINIEAKEFMSADVLTIKLADTNYEPRWVNMSPLNIGDKIAKGFTYIEPKDLQPGKAEAIQTSLDSQGHYRFNDVVAMKIDKATYYAALKAAHLRAISTTNSIKLSERVKKSADAFMQTSDSGNDFRNAAAQKKMVFYDPGIGV